MKQVNREKVIKGLEVCTSIEDGKSCPKECPYYQDVCYGYDQLMRDALVLLKEQEAVNKNIGEWKNGHCSCCGKDVSSMLDTWTNVQNFLFCPNCGAKMEEW